MTSEDPAFLARWSQRKRAARSGSAPSPQEAPPDADPSPGETETPASEPSSPATAESAEPVAPLPSLDDLTAESDLGAYLREGVPDLLRRTALRKMWSIDPAIRDHIGLSENSWDFNQPESIPGFGPIGARTAGPAFLSDPEALSNRVAEHIDPRSEPSPLRAPDHATPAPRLASSDASGLPPAEDQPAPPADPEPGTQTASATGESAEPAPAKSVRRHGGALPRD